MRAGCVCETRGERWHGQRAPWACECGRSVGAGHGGSHGGTALAASREWVCHWHPLLACRLSRLPLCSKGYTAFLCCCFLSHGGTALAAARERVRHWHPLLACRRSFWKEVASAEMSLPCAVPPDIAGTFCRAQARLEEGRQARALRCILSPTECTTRRSWGRWRQTWWCPTS